MEARLIVNPAAAGGRDRERVLQEAAGVLAQRGWTVTWRRTREAGHACDLARQAASERVTAVFVAGGDGTVNEVTNGLVGTATAMGVLPAGTGNVLAAQLGLVGIPTPLHRPEPAAAARHLCEGRVHWVDVGLARRRDGEARHFLLWAGVGLDAAVAHELEGASRHLKRRFGALAYGWVGLKRLLHRGAPPAVVRADAARTRDALVQGLVANIPLYAGTVTITPQAQPDDGLLDVVLFLEREPWFALDRIGAALRGREPRPAGLLRDRAARVRIVAARPLPIHLDAEPFGRTPVTIALVPRGLRLIVPPTAPAGLFRQPGRPLAAAET